MLYSIACENDASEAANVEFLGGVPQWNVIFSKEIHDWEVDAVTGFFQKLQTVSIRMGSQDKLWWIPSKKGIFKVKIYSEHCPMQKVAVFLGRVCGGPSLPPGLRFLCGQQRLKKFLP